MPLLLVNENFPAPATHVLRATGIDVKSVADVAAGIADEQVLAMACDEHRWPITFDSDHGELLFVRRPLLRRVDGSS